MACTSCQAVKQTAKASVRRARNPSALFPGPLAQAGFYGPNMGRGFPRNLGPGFRRGRPRPAFGPAWPSLGWWGAAPAPYPFGGPLVARVAAPAPVALVRTPYWARRARAYY